MMNSENQPLLSRNAAPAGGSSFARRSTRFRTRFACGAILLTETLERIAFYGIVGNLVMFLNQSPFAWASYNAANALFLFTGLAYMTSLFGGWLADTFLGKCRTIVFFFVVYISGYLFFPLLRPYPTPTDADHPPAWCDASWDNSSSPWVPYVNTRAVLLVDEPCAWAVYLALTIIAIGSGAVRANMAPFGADQIKQDGPFATRIFFNWFYWCINVGALISFGVLAYVQQEISFFWGYVAPTICLAFALIVMLIGYPFYIMKPPGGSVITNVIKILVESCRMRRRFYKSLQSENEALQSSSEEADLPRHCIDFAKVRYGGSFHDNVVEDVKTLGKIICVFIALVPYWTVYFQMETTFLVQGLHMRLDFGVQNDDDNSSSLEFNHTNVHHHKDFKVAAAWLSLFDVIFLIILIPLFDRFIYPRLDRAGLTPTLRGRIIIGMIFAVLAVCTAGVVEMYRLNVYWRNGTENVYWQKIGHTLYRAADVTILLQIPQYALIGISEVFASVAGLELAYMHAPRCMQGSIMGLFRFSQGIGSMVGTASLFGFRGKWFFDWDHGDINCRIPCRDDPSRICYKCHLDYYFFFLGLLQLFGIVLFAIIAWRLDVGTGSPYSNNRRTAQTHTAVTSAASSGSASQTNPNVQDHIIASQTVA